MAVGLLRPDAGRSRVFGVDVWDGPVRAKALIGVLPDGLALPEQLTGRELLDATSASCAASTRRRWPGGRTSCSTCWS